MAVAFESSQRVKELRHQLGWTQATLARALGLSPLTIERWEQGRARPSPAAQRLLAHLAATAAPSARHNLPTPPTPFIGRTAALATLADLLCATRLLTLTGPGGCGKTRLALALAQSILSRYPHGAWFVDLGAISNHRLVLPTVAATLGLHEGPGAPLLDQLCALLADRRLLLVLDNAEHLRGVLAALAQTLLARCPQLTLLVTSRVALGLAGEQRWPVPPLTLPPEGVELTPALLEASEAGALFVARARARVPTFAVTPANVTAVAAVCRGLDGNPLALELAAARLGVLSVEQLAVGMGQWLQLLGAGGADLPARQRTLRATLAWSYGLLSELGQQLVRGLAVFAGGATLAAVQAVVLPELERAAVLAAVEEGVEHALVVVADAAGEARYQLLAVVREYAAEQLAVAGEDAVVARRHAYYFTTLAEQLGPDLRSGNLDAALLNQLGKEQENFRAAQAWLHRQGETEMYLRLVTSLWRFWWLRKHLSEGRAALAVPLDTRDDSLDALRAHAWNAAGVLAREQGDYAAARTLLTAALALRNRLEDGLAIADTLNNLGTIAWDQGDFAEARKYYKASLEHYRQNDRTWGVALVLNNLALVARDQGEYDQATELLRESLALVRKINDREGEARALGNLGRLLYAQGKLDLARALNEEAAALQRASGDDRGLTFSLRTLAQIACMAGQQAAARRLIHESLALEQRAGNQRGLARSLAVFARIACIERDSHAAVEAAREQLLLRQKIGDTSGLLEGLELCAHIACTASHWLQVARLYAAATALRAKLGCPRPPVDEPGVEKDLTAIRAALGKRAWEDACVSAQDLELVQAVGEATEELSALAMAAPQSAHAGRSLTKREREILQLLAAGQSNAAIAAALTLSVRTVEHHLATIYAKLGVRSRTEAVARALHAELLSPPEALQRP